VAKGGYVKVKWYGSTVIPDVKRRLVGPRIQLAAAAIQGAAKRGVSRSQPTRGTGLRKRGLDPSRPGEYPKRVTGHLMRNINRTFSASELVARVGTNVKYGRYLELGTRKMARRPWLSKALHEAMPELRRLLGG